MELEKHYVNRSGWLRASVLGANDGILSTTSLIIGVAAATQDREAIIIAGLAGLVAGALSMAAGEYVSVSSQSDVETADLAREQYELDTMPEIEMRELAKIYVKRGLDETLALEVARQLHAKDALEAHARDELGINEITKARPLQAALASALAFMIGGLMPLLVAIFFPMDWMIAWQYGLALIFLAGSGALTARVGGSPILKSIFRICLWGTVAMLTSAGVGYLFDVSVA